MSRRDPLDLERLVLCAALNDMTAWHTATRSLMPRDFADARHQTIYAAVMGLEPAGRTPDTMSLFAGFSTAGKRDLIEYVQDLMTMAFVYDALPAWITAVLTAAQARRTHAALTAAAGAIADGLPLEDVTHTLDQALAAIRADAPDARVFDDKAKMAADALAFLTEDGRGGTPYGFHSWDAAVLPAMPSHLILFGGASGAGKSLVARNTIRQGVQRYEARTGLLTCEMSGEEQMVHYACMDAQVPIEDYYRRRLTDAQTKRFTAELEAWRDTDRLKINEMGSCTPIQALRIFRRWREQGVTHFVLDHLHRLDYGANKSGDDLRIPIASFAKDLKNFAKDSEATVYALVQYSKIKPHDEPSDDKIREANQVLEEADAVFHIYRPLVACERDTAGALYPLTKPDGHRYFEHEAPKGSTLAPDRESVYVKLGKQRRRLRDGLIRIPFNHTLGLMYDTTRQDIRRIA